MVRKNKKVRAVTEEFVEETSSQSEDYFIGIIESEESKAKWFVNLSLGKTMIRFKIDTVQMSLLFRSLFMYGL